MKSTKTGYFKESLIADRFQFSGTIIEISDVFLNALKFLKSQVLIGSATHEASWHSVFRYNVLFYLMSGYAKKKKVSKYFEMGCSYYLWDWTNNFENVLDSDRIGRVATPAKIS